LLGIKTPAGAMIAKPKTLARCAWASDDLAIRYPEEECGVPVNDDRTLFEFLILEGALDM